MGSRNGFATIFGCEKWYLKKGSQLAKLDPFIDSTGVLRVGGRLKSSDLDFKEKPPVTLGKKTHMLQNL